MTQRYRSLLRATLVEALERRKPAPLPTRVGWVAIEPIAMAFVRGAIDGFDQSPLRSELFTIDASSKVADGFGHARDVYRGLAWYAAGRLAMRRVYEGPLPTVTSPIRADAAHVAVEHVWYHVDEPAAPWLESQQADGTFIVRSNSDNPEPFWYHEMILMHAAATRLARRDDSALRQVVAKSARYFVHEVQPDHASSQPWGVHALLTHEEGWTLVDLVLHGAGVQQPATMDAVSLLLLADAYDALRGRGDV